MTPSVVRQIGGRAVSVVLADIVALDVDAIVNAANEQLSAGGGVCGAIFASAGPELESACRPLRPCPTGESRITPGFGLKARHVVHAVGPVWDGGTRNEVELLSRAYRSALQVAASAGAASIAFPSISTGVYGFPKPLACETAVDAVLAALDGLSSIKSVVFCCFDRESFDIYVRRFAT